MKKSDFLKQLEILGLPLFEPEQETDVNMVLAEVIKTGDVRLWEGFPLILANSFQKGLFNYDAVMQKLEDKKDKKVFNQMILISLALYESVPVKFVWTDKLLKAAQLKKTELQLVSQELKSQEDKIILGRVSSQRLKNIFMRYFQEQKESLDRFVVMKEDFSLEYALSQVFSAKQKELFFKKLKNEKLTKTEKEYYSRVVKKKVLALANEELQRLSKRILKG